MPDPIRSYSNPFIKRIRAVAAGLEPETLLLDGDRLVDDAIAAGLEFEVLLVSVHRQDRAAQLREAGQRPIFVEHFLLDRVAKLKHSPGVLALAKAPRRYQLDELSSTQSDAYGNAPLLVVTAGISDPVNLGALVRSSEAAGATALVNISNTGVGLWNPRALRGSMGSLLRLPIYDAKERSATATQLADMGFQLVRPATRGGMNYLEFDWSPAIALWIDSETGQISEESRQFAAVSIPMAGAVDSLNVTMASVVLLYAARRVG